MPGTTDRISRLRRFLPPNLFKRFSTKSEHRGTLLNVHSRLRTVKYQVSTYLPRTLEESAVKLPSPGIPTAEILSGSLLFADVSGFTALSEHHSRLGPAGSERLTDILNIRFDRMVAILAQSGGILLKFAGDAVLAYFPELPRGQHSQWAIRTAHRMINAISEFADISTPIGGVRIQIKIGVSSGSFGALQVGSPQRMEYVVLGRTVGRALGAEAAAQPGSIMIDRATAAFLHPSELASIDSGFTRVLPVDEQALGTFEVGGATGRDRPTSSWLSTTQELLGDIDSFLDDLERLMPFLPAELAQVIVAAAKRRRLPGEFRLSTVMFLHFSGFVDVMEQWGVLPSAPGDPRNALYLLNSYFNAIQRIVAAHGGVITRIDPYKDGSKALILFGAPVAHEDDPVRACHAAHAAKTELLNLRRQWSRTTQSPSNAVVPAQSICQRMGITHGATYAGQAGTATRREYTVMGDTVNLAARLMGAAARDQILVSQPVSDSVSSLMQSERLPPIQVKGKSGQIAVFRIGAPVAGSVVDVDARDRTAIGREEQVAAGLAFLANALEGKPSVLHIWGSPGIGKSHLAHAILSASQISPTAVHAIRCPSHSQQSAFHGLRAMLGSICGITPDMGPLDRLRQINRLLTQLELDGTQAIEPMRRLMNLDLSKHHRAPEGPAARRATPRTSASGFASLLGSRVDRHQTDKPTLWQTVSGLNRASSSGSWLTLRQRIAEQESDRLLGAAHAVIERLCAHGETVLHVEDAQWMDVETRRLLGSLLRRLTTDRLALLLVERADDPAEISLGADCEEFLVLGPLPDKAVETLLARSLRATFPAEQVQVWIGRTRAMCQGNPLIAHELGRWLAETRPSDPELLAFGLSQSSVLQQMVLSRLDRLAYPTRELARVAAAIGVQFTLHHLEALVSTELSEHEISPGLEELRQANFLRWSDPEEKQELYFVETLVQEAIYASLSHARRRKLHASSACYLETHFANDLAGREGLLALLHEKAGLPIVAARYMLMAATREFDSQSPERAFDFLGRALDLLGSVPPEEDPPPDQLWAEIHERYAVAAFQTERAEIAAQEFLLARAALLHSPEKLTTTISQARLLNKAAIAYQLVRQPDKAVEWALEAVRLSEDTHAGPAATLAWILWRQKTGDPTSYLDHALELVARAGDDEAPLLRSLLMDLSGAHGAAEETFLAKGEAAGAALAACRLGDWLLAEGDLATALSAFGRASGYWTKSTDHTGLMLAEYRLAECSWQQGDKTAALEHLTAIGRTQDQTSDLALDKALVTAALELIQGNSRAPWPDWQRCSYDDRFCSSILMQS